MCAEPWGCIFHWILFSFFISIHCSLRSSIILPICKIHFCRRGNSVSVCLSLSLCSSLFIHLVCYNDEMELWHERRVYCDCLRVVQIVHSIWLPFYSRRRGNVAGFVVHPCRIGNIISGTPPFERRQPQPAAAATTVTKNTLNEREREIQNLQLTKNSRKL